MTTLSRTLVGLLLTALLGSAGTAAAQDLTMSAFRDPSADLRPRFTWWWPGPAVNDAELRAEVKEMAAAGFGGAQTFEAPGLGLPPKCPLANALCVDAPGSGPPERYAWGTPEWAQRVRTALQAARDHAFRIDLQVSSGWPWNSPAVSGDHSALAQQQLVFGHLEVSGRSTYVDPPPRPVDVDLSGGRLVAAVAGRLENERIIDPDSMVDLTPTLDAQGRVHWSVPGGRWVVFGFWQAPTRQRSNDSTRSNDPLILDYLNPRATEAATRDLDERLLNRVAPLTADVADLLHTDSLEFQYTGLMWTGRFLDEFRSRRGYDLIAYLPALTVAGWQSDDQDPAPPLYDFSASTGERVRRDYNETLTELWVDNHVRPATAWARRHGLGFQGRAHGSTMDVVAVNKAYDASDSDPFGGPIDYTRTITSGSRLAGKEKASLEVGDVAFEDYMMTLETLKHHADKGFVGGANEQVLHGYPYKFANGASWPSWWPWSSEWDVVGRDIGFSEGFTPAIPNWRHLRALADYLARAQTVLRAGRPVTDLAIYRDVYGYGQVEDPKAGEDGEPLLNTALARSGFNFDIVDPGTLAEPATGVQDGRLVVQRPGYRGLVVDLAASQHQGVIDNSDAMSASVARRLVAFARDGLPIVFVGRFPGRGVSNRDPEAEDRAVCEAVAELQRSPRVRLVRDEAGVPAALDDLGVGPDLSFHGPRDVYSVHTRTARGDYWFVWNGGERSAHFKGSFAAGGRAPDVWDLWSGDRRPLALYQMDAGGRVGVPIELAPGASVVIGFERPAEEHVESTTADTAVVHGGELSLRSSRGGVASARLSDGQLVSVQLGELPAPLEPRRWALHVDGAVPQGEEHHDLELTRLLDWRDIPSLRHTSGTGTYRATVTLGDDWSREGRGAYLALGRVEGGVQVRVNGRRVYPASVPPPRIDVGRFLRRGENTIEVELTTTLKNRLVELSGHDPSYARFQARPSTQPYGLLGPVRLIPYAEGTVR